MRNPWRAPASWLGRSFAIAALVLASSWGEAWARKPLPLPEAATEALSRASEDRATAIQTLEGLLDDVAPELRPTILLHLAEQHRLAGDAEQARALFVRAMSEGGADLETPALLGLALLDAEANLDGPALATLFEARESFVLPTQNVDRYAWLALRALRAAEGGPSAEADSWRSRALRWAGDDALLAARVEARMQAPEADKPPRGAPPTTAGAPTTTPVAPPAVDAGALLRRARAALAAGDPLGAASLASEALASGDPRVQDDGARILQQGNLPPADAGKVGVLLPLDGRYAAVAAQIRDALVDGWSQVARPEQLVFMATDGTQASALAGFDALVLEQHVIGVIGPLRPDETPGVVDRAQELGVPLLSLSQSLDDPSPWPWVFQAWVTPRAQVRALLDVVMDDRHARDFAIYAPQSAYGTLAATVFTEEVAARGGAVVARVDYPEDTKTHATYVAKLRQPDPDPTHPEPWYDAIFVPDSGARVILGAAAMAGQEISVGAFRAQRREPAPLLGLSAWTRYDLVTSGGAPLQHGLFTDVYIAPPSTAGLTWSPLDAWPAFTDRFQASYGRAPSNLEAMASDVARVVATALRAGPTDRVALREQLLATRAPGTVTGVRGFDPATRLLQRDITVFSVEAAGLQPVPHLDAP